jgi:hypothetical protein
MRMVTRNQPTRILMLAIASVAAIGSYLFINSDDSGTAHVITEYSIPIFPTISEAIKASDGVMEIQIVSTPTTYEDFGEDSKPDFPGQEPELIEIVKARVISVISGNSNLQGKEILLSQTPASQNQEDSDISSRMKNGSRVIMIGHLVTANKDVVNGAQVWVPHAGGQGVLDISSDDSISVRSDLIYTSDFINGQSMSRANFETLTK